MTPLDGASSHLNFSEDFANLFKGLRVDSGDNMEQLQRICAKYRSLGIDSKTKQVIFSNALDTDGAIALQQEAEKYVQPSFGIGTHFTNDFDGVRPMNIVIKLVAAKITESWPFYNDTCKISEDTWQAHWQSGGDPPLHGGITPLTGG
jgi:nicotinate phosphoribosyltransferase